MAERDDINAYLQTVEQELSGAALRTYPCQQALRKLLESFQGIQTATDAQRAQIGAPEIIVQHRQTPLGGVVTLDVGRPIAALDSSPIAALSIRALPNVIVTNYIEFRHYAFGELLRTAQLGEIQEGRLKRHRDGADSVMQVLQEFIYQIMPTIRRARDAAEQLGMLARLLREIMAASLASESPNRDMLAQIQAFRDQLQPDLTPDQFADVLAQAVTYSLFAARVRHKGAGRSEPFRRRDVKWDLPPTNTFIKAAFDQLAGADLDPRAAWLADIMTDVVAHMDMQEIASDLARRRRRDDPFVSFHGAFLGAYHPTARDGTAADTTPEPVINYIVQSVDYLLRRRFKYELGLADPKALIVDPAAGTGRFLYAVLQQIHDTLRLQRQLGAWNDYVSEYLLPRVFGLEMSLADYAVAHGRIGYALQEKSYTFDSGQRLGIYLANALERPPVHKPGDDFGGLLAAEMQGAQLPLDKPLALVLGSPPLIAPAQTAWIDTLVQDTYPSGAENADVLQTAYVKYLRLGQWIIEQAANGVMAFITDSSYLKHSAFAGMRHSLLKHFSDIYILNLHGDAHSASTAPDGEIDQNILNGETGLAISFFVKQSNRPTPARLHYADLYGQRAQKLDYLDTSALYDTLWTEIHPLQTDYLFVPHDENHAEEYEAGVSIGEIFVTHSTGINTNRDQFALDFDQQALESRIARFRNLGYPDEDIRRSFDLRDTQTWRLGDQRRELSALPDDQWRQHLSPCLYRPFDIRTLYYHPAVVSQPRDEVMQHLLAGENLALCTTNQSEDFTHVLCSSVPVDNDAVSSATRERTYIFPLYLYPSPDHAEILSPFAPGMNGRRPNLNPHFVQMAASRLGMRFVSDQLGDCKQTFGPPDIFAYIYAVLHSPTYRRRYAAFIPGDFPRIPFTSDKKLFRGLVRRGRQLINAHLMRKPGLQRLITGYTGQGSALVDEGYPRYVQFAGERGARVYINEGKYFESVPEAVWEFQIGGYRVLEKWLQDRRGRRLSFEEVLYIQRVAVAINETLRLMGKIDDYIPSWPVV